MIGNLITLKTIAQNNSYLLSIGSDIENSDKHKFSSSYIFNLHILAISYIPARKTMKIQFCCGRSLNMHLLVIN